MILYLDKFYNEHFTWYKRGHTKWMDPLKRYEGHYLLDHGVELECLSFVHFSANDWRVAKTIAESIEHVMNNTWPCKNDPKMVIEDHLKVPRFDGMLDGATEFIYLKEGQTEDQLIEHFGESTKDIWKIINKVDTKKDFKPMKYSKVKV